MASPTPQAWYRGIRPSLFSSGNGHYWCVYKLIHADWKRHSNTHTHKHTHIHTHIHKGHLMAPVHSSHLSGLHLQEPAAAFNWASWGATVTGVCLHAPYTLLRDSKHNWLRLGWKWKVGHWLSVVVVTGCHDWVSMCWDWFQWLVLVTSQWEQLWPVN